MLDPTLTAHNLASIAAQPDLLTDDRLRELADHPASWNGLRRWCDYVTLVPFAERATIPPPKVMPDLEPVATTSRRRPRLAILAAAVIMTGGISTAAWAFTRDVEADPLFSQGGGFACQVTDSTVSCFGRNDMGQLGDAAASQAATFDAGFTPTIIDSGSNFTCMTDGATVSCFGDNTWRQAADSDKVIVAPTIMDLPGQTVTSLSVGNIHACAVTSGEVYCWGSDYSGQLGSGSQGVEASAPVKIDLPAATSVTALDFATCADTSDGRWCWGANDDHRISESDELILPPIKVNHD